MLSSPTCLSESFKDFSFDTASPATTALPKPISHPIKNWRASSFGTKRKRSLPQGTLRQSRSGRFAKLVSNTSDSNASMSRSLLCTVKVRDDETVNSCDVREFDGKDNLVVNVHVISSVYLEMAVCRHCQSGDLHLFNKGTKAGCATLLLLSCLHCHVSKSFWSVSGRFGSSIDVGSGKSIPKRNSTVYASVLAGRLIGVGCERLSLYHASLGIPSCPAASTFSDVECDILTAAESIANKCMDKASVDLERILGLNQSTGLVHAVGSFDGAYQQRSGRAGGGFSRYCFASVISCQTSKVLAYEVACNNCSICNQHSDALSTGRISQEAYEAWHINHKEHCPASYSDVSSVRLESELAPVIISHCLKRGVLLTGLVCDGDNKTFTKVSASNPYHQVGWTGEIERFECLSHVLKRMKTHLVEEQSKVLRANLAKKSFEKQSLLEQGQDKRTVDKALKIKFQGNLVRTNVPRADWGGESSCNSRKINHLSDALCGQITSYYRMAVIRSKGDVSSIVDAINAIPLHLGANDDNASNNHRLCPLSENSWCQYLLAIWHQKPVPHHPNYLSDEAVGYIHKLLTNYKYNDPDFIRKISDGRTSNNNEAMHHVLFQMARKNEQVSNTVMRLSAALAVIRYNARYSGIR